MPTADEVALLRSIGTDILRSFVAVVVETIGVVVYTVLVIKAANILLQKDRWRSGVTQTMLVLILALYIMRLCLWMIDIHDIITELDITLISRSSDDLEARYAKSGKAALRLGLVEDVLYAYMVLLGDAIIFSRVYAFWHIGREKLMLVLPCLVFVGTIVLTCLVNFCASNSNADIQYGSFRHPPFCLKIQLTSYWFQVGSALIAAALIGLKTWKIRQMIRPLMEKNSRLPPVYKVMTIIVDTGILYMLFFTIEAILSLDSFSMALRQHPGLSFALVVYQFQTSTIVGIYPTLIVVLVHSQLTLVDQEGNTTCLTTLQFEAVPGTRPATMTMTNGTSTATRAGDTAGSDIAHPKLDPAGGAEVNVQGLHYARSTATMTCPVERLLGDV